jgi:hypothetical protein
MKGSSATSRAGISHAVPYPPRRHRRNFLVGLAALAVALGACVAPGAAPVASVSGAASPEVTPMASASGAASPEATPVASASGGLDLSQDGAELQISSTSSVLAAGQPASIDVTFTNRRNTVLMYDTNQCWAQVALMAALPLAPVGKAWTGSAGAFKDYALKLGLAPGGAAATDPMVLGSDASCGPSDSFETALAPGASVSGTFPVPTQYVKGVPIVPQTADVKVSIGYDLQNPPPSYPPDYSGPRGGYVPIFHQIAIETKLTIGGTGPTLITAGEAIDAALSNSDFANFVERAPASTCGGNVNLYLTDNEGAGDLPAGPAWMVESLCDSPRQFRILAIDPFTGAITAAIKCDVPCDR